MNAQQLKNSILQMAVSGKLVPQDPNDEPARVLLERIRAEKEELIRAGKIKREKNPSRIFRGSDNAFYEQIGNKEPVSIADEIPFDIPDSWEWVRLGNIFYHNTGKALNASNQTGQFLEYITTSNLYWNRFELDSLRQMYFTDEEIEKCTATKGDLLVCEGGEIGRAAIWPYEYDIRIQNHIHRLRAYIPICTQFFYYIFYLYKHVGWIGGKGIGIQGLSSNALHALLFPLPPIEEQKRIVKKIKEIEPFTEKYAVAEAHLNSLNLNFPEQLKKSILQEAVQGKLAPQDPDDEPASVLLERIRAEKERLKAEGKIKRDKNESVIYKRDNSHYEKINGTERCIDDEIPFDIPDNWEWERLGNIGETNIGLTYSPSDKSNDDGIPVLRSNNIQNGNIDYSGLVYVSCYVPERAMIHEGDILICVRNGSRSLVGKAAIISQEGMAFGAFMAKFASPINPYILIFLESPVFRSRLDGVKTETVNQITQEMIKKQLIPIPPLSEQHRIVEKIEELMPMIKAL